MTKTACPGFASYEILGNGLVQVNGAVPIFSDSTRIEMLQNAWASYGAVIARVAWNHDVPAPWILGILMQESGGGDPAMTCSPCSASCCSEAAGRSCCAHGIMQFTGPTAAMYGTSAAALQQDPALALDKAAEFLSESFRKYDGDFVKMAAAYNGGPGVLSKCGGGDATFGYSTNSNYVSLVVKWSNTALSLGLKMFPPRKASFFAGLVGAAALAGGAYYAMQKGWLPWRIRL